MLIYIHKMKREKTSQNKIRVTTKRKANKAERSHKMTNIMINYSNNTIEVSATFLKKASKFGSAEYEELRKVRNTEPTFTVKEISIKRNSNKKTYNRLTFDAMIAHIEFIEKDELNREKALNEMKEIKLYSSARGSSYPIVKKWFLSKYKESYTNIMTELEETA